MLSARGWPAARPAAGVAEVPPPGGGVLGSPLASRWQPRTHPARPAPLGSGQPRGEPAGLLQTWGAPAAHAIHQQRKSAPGSLTLRPCFGGKFFQHELPRQRICANRPGFAPTWSGATVPPAPAQPERSVHAAHSRPQQIVIEPTCLFSVLHALPPSRRFKPIRDR